jgi:hypothetical protein
MHRPLENSQVKGIQEAIFIANDTHVSSYHTSYTTGVRYPVLTPNLKGLELALKVCVSAVERRERTTQAVKLLRTLIKKKDPPWYWAPFFCTTMKWHCVSLHSFFGGCSCSNKSIYIVFYPLKGLNSSQCPTA